MQNFGETMILMLIKEFPNAVHFEICLFRISVHGMYKESRDSISQYTS